MLRRPLHLLTCGVLLVAATATTAVSADKERPKRESTNNTPNSSSSNKGNSNSNSGSTPRRVLPGRLDAPVVTPRSGGNAKPQQTQPQNTPQNAPRKTQTVPNLDALRNRQPVRPQTENKPPQSGNTTRSLPPLNLPNVSDRTPRLPQPGNTGNRPGSTGVVPNGGLPDRRLEQFRGQSPNDKDTAKDTSATQIRERMQRQLEQQRQAGGKKPELPSDLRDRINNTRPNDGLNNKVGKPDDKPRVPNPDLTPKLDDLRGRIETRKPELDGNAKSEADRLRERFNDGLNNRPGNMQRPGGKVDGPVIGNRDGKAPIRIEKNGLIRDLDGLKPIVERGQRPERIRNPDDLQRTFDRLQNTQEVRNVLQNTNLKLNDFSGAFQTNLRRGNYANIARTDFGKKHDLDRQFNLFIKGDVTRQLNLNQQFVARGGWAKRPIGPVYSKYTSAHFSAWYPGPAWYPSYCWTPIWSPWVSWSFWGHPSVIYDPRPFYCRPIYYYDPCPPIVYYDYPIWSPLPVVASGTWVDVPVVSVPSGYDVQLLAVRFVDPGHPEEQLGPRYRVWLRNNSLRPIQSPFNVTVVAANDDNLIAGLPQAGVTVPEMEVDAVVPVDIRLPFEANRMNQMSNGQRAPFTRLHVLVDSHAELPEADESNNGLAIARGEVLPVDPAAFSTDVTTANRGSLVSLAGEGFGPEPGQIVVLVGDREYPAEIHGWYDLGVNFQMPSLPMNGTQTAQVLVIRGDGAASNPVTMEVLN